MEVLIFIIIVGAFLYFATKDGYANIEKQTKTKDGNALAEVTVLQCDNVPQGVKSRVVCAKDGLEITSSGYNKIIPYENVSSISVESANQTASNNQFSLGKAAVGTALFGAVGAVGGLTGKNYIPKTLVISYTEGDETKYMVFLQQMSGGINTKAEGDWLNISCEMMKKTINNKKYINLYS